MNKIFQNKTFKTQLIELSKLPLTVKTIRNNPSIDQTSRNQIRRELMKSLLEWLQSELEGEVVNGVYWTNNGIALEVENDSLVEGGISETGMVTLTLQVKVENLAYDAVEDQVESPTNN